MFWGTCVFSETLTTPKPIQIVTIVRDYINALTSIKLVVFSLVVGCCSAISYCFSAAGPQIAHDILKLSAAQYGYWNSVNIIGMLIGGILSKQCLGRLSAHQVIKLGFLGVAMGIASLAAIYILSSQSATWFFITTAELYLFSSFLFAAGSLIASNALEDKASAAAMMSFVNMCFATISVIAMGYLMNNPLLGFIVILSLIWLLVVSFVCINNKQT